MPGDSWLASLDAWITREPEPSPCYCGDCEECAQREAREDAYDRWVDRCVDKAKEGER